MAKCLISPTAIFSVCFTLLLGVLGLGSSHVEVTPVHIFPVGTFVENLAVRECGLILATLVSTPQVVQVDPYKQGATDVFATIPRHLSVAGITEVQPDIFYVAANNLTFNPLVSQPNASSVYRIDASAAKPSQQVQPKLIADFPAAGFLNGLTTLDSKRGLILLADSFRGVVWRLNVFTGEKKIVISDPLMQAANVAVTPFGINGIKIQNGNLYWSNTNLDILARIAISKDGLATGQATVVAHYGTPDDFALYSNSQNFEGILAAGNDTVRYVNKDVVRIVSDSPLVKGSTAVAKARGKDSRDKIYITTCGGIAQFLSGNVTVPGKIVAIQLKDY